MTAWQQLQDQAISLQDRAKPSAVRCFLSFSGAILSIVARFLSTGMRLPKTPIQQN
jgi:hypothetical protein